MSLGRNKISCNPNVAVFDTNFKGARKKNYDFKATMIFITLSKIRFGLRVRKY